MLSGWLLDFLSFGIWLVSQIKIFLIIHETLFPPPQIHMKFKSWKPFINYVMQEAQEDFYLILFMFVSQLYFYVLGPRINKVIRVSYAK